MGGSRELSSALSPNKAFHGVSNSAFAALIRLSELGAIPGSAKRTTRALALRSAKTSRFSRPSEGHEHQLLCRRSGGRGRGGGWAKATEADEKADK